MVASAELMDERPWKCGICGASFYIQEALEVHRGTHQVRIKTIE